MIKAIVRASSQMPLTGNVSASLTRLMRTTRPVEAQFGLQNGTQLGYNAFSLVTIQLFPIQTVYYFRRGV